MDTLLQAPRTVEGFLAWEDAQEGRHEFDGKHALPMTGGSRAHQRIIFNLLALLTAHLSPAFDAVQEMRVRVGGTVRHPDVCVCAGPIPPSAKTLADAVAIFEVLSDDTAATDRDGKLAEYAALPGIRCYVLVDQSRVGLTVHRRNAGNWETAEHAAGTLKLPEIGVALAVADIYRGL